MYNIHLTTFIQAPLERVFDLCRSISIYKNLFSNRKETFASGASGNLLGSGDTITIHAKHLGKIRSSTLKITSFEKAQQFTLEQTKGDLISFKHEQHFKTVQNGTILIDMVSIENPRDFIGRLIGHFYIKSYIREMIESRNELSRQYAESEKWKVLLK